MGNYTDVDGNQVYGKEFIKENLYHSQPCEVCEGELTEHEWIALEHNGMVILCSVRNVLPKRASMINEEFKFNQYVALDSFGNVVKTMDRVVLEDALREYNSKHTRFLGIWEFQESYDEVSRQTFIDARISPVFQIDQHDDNWRRPTYTFIPLAA